MTPVPGTVTAEGTPINKANLLTDETAALLGLSNSAVPNDAFEKLRSLISTAQSIAEGRAILVTGSYSGTGSGTKKIITAFRPKCLIIDFPYSSSRYVGIWAGGNATYVNTTITTIRTGVTIEDNGITLSNTAFNASNSEYHWCIFG